MSSVCVVPVALALGWAQSRRRRVHTPAVHGRAGYFFSGPAGDADRSVRGVQRPRHGRRADPSRALALVARDHYSAIVADGGELLADDPLERLARRVDPNLFIRVHRSAFINLSLLAELVHEGDRRYVAVLANAAATRIPISRERLPALKAALGLS